MSDRPFESSKVSGLRRQLDLRSFRTAGTKAEFGGLPEAEMNTCVPAESHENVLEPVDDALELDASDSDVEAEGDTSTNTVVLASSANDSTLVSPEVIASSGVDINQEPLNAVNDKPTEADLELSAEKPRGRKKSDASQPSLSVDSSRTTTEKPAGRRRQWGSSGHDRIVVKSKNVASDSLEVCQSMCVVWLNDLLQIILFIIDARDVIRQLPLLLKWD
ncbi:hypothetical protein P879_09358 [Paragonimus westermani]|uniref:Uncharacterized protein n=1 Tax=Paragonimus westermani TaxID=34504 RepID=A0A8T0DEN9_9TREM|nr:hypothetical protein P879_09358 [Paragonimus westermani]